MVKMFQRSVSFPSKSVKPQHMRSISLPCRSHPLISQLRDAIDGLNAWHARPESRTSPWLCDGLRQLKHVHDLLDDLLHIPTTQDSLRRSPLWAHKLLDDFLLLVDVYGIFQSSILSLREDHSAAQVAVRRRDRSKVPLYVKSRSHLAKEMHSLASTIKFMARDAAAAPDTDLACVVDDVVRVTKMVSTALFNGISQRPPPAWRLLWGRGKRTGEIEQLKAERLWGLNKMGEEEVRAVSERMRDLEIDIVGLENGSQRVFRGLITARVSLLNSLTQ